MTTNPSPAWRKAPPMRKRNLDPSQPPRRAAVIAAFALSLAPISAAGQGAPAAHDAPAAEGAPAALPPPEGALPSVERVSLAQAVKRAQARNVSMVVAVEEIRRAEALVREARASWLPTLTGNAIYTRLDTNRIFGDRVVSAKDQLSANLSLTVPLVVPQRWAQWSCRSKVSLDRGLIGRVQRRAGFPCRKLRAAKAVAASSRRRLVTPATRRDRRRQS